MPRWLSVCVSATSNKDVKRANRRILFQVCFLGGPIVNKIGVKWALVIGSMSFPIQGSAYYCNSKFGNQWVSARTF